MTEKSSCLHAIVHGRVQGVGFRYFVRENAKRLNLSGWTRNRYNRTVEVLAEGEESALNQFLEILNNGPPSSNVLNVEIEWRSPLGEFRGFKIRMTR